MKFPTPILLEDRYYVRREDKTMLAEEELTNALSESVPSIQQHLLSNLEHEGRGGNDSTNLVSKSLQRRGLSTTVPLKR